MKIDAPVIRRLALVVSLSTLYYPVAAAAQSSRRDRDEAEEDYVSVEQIYPTHPLLLTLSPRFSTYAHHPFANYDDASFPYTSSRRTFYGPLGDRLISGFDVVQWQEDRTTTGRSQSEFELQEGRYANVFDRVIVASDAAKGWSARAIYGNEILTMFTPLTLYWSGFNGLRIDWLKDRTQISTVGSRLGHKLNPIFILGGHAQHSLGVFDLGATYVNIHSTNLDRGEESLKGTFPNTRRIPRFLAVKIADESPEDDRGGPRVFDVKVWIGGRERPDIRPDVVRYSSLQTSVGRTSVGDRFTASPYSTYRVFGSFRDIIGDIWEVAAVPLELPLYADYMYLKDHLDGVDVSQRVSIPRLTSRAQLLAAEVHAADGEDYLVYYFDLGDLADIEAVELGFLMGNDYHISISDVQPKTTRNDPYERRFRADFFRTVTRARGNVQDLSNVRWVKFKYGAPTGLSIYSFDASVNFRGLEIQGEFATSLEHNQFPDIDLNGARHNQQARAWYAVATKDFERWGLGGELFSMSPDYKTFLTVHNLEQRFPGTGFINESAVYHLVQDNDDHDRYADVWFGNPNSEDIDGIFPGKDEDQDGLPDTNKNYNDIPDYREPFLMFDVESDNYVYGADMDNNDVPDEREDDLDPEYPYDLDLKGAHLMGWFAPLPRLRLMLGRLHAEQIAGGRRNRMLYGRLNYRMTQFGLGSFELEHELKRVRDDIPDETLLFREDTIRPFQSAGGGNYHPQFGADDIADELNYRNSLVKRTYLNTRLTGLPRLAVVNRIKLEINDQRQTLFDDGTFQRQDRIRLLVGVHKASYTWESRHWRVVPQLKVLYLKKERRHTDVPLKHERQFIPIFKAEYRLTERTSVKGGIQGFPWLKYQIRDLTDPSKSFDRQNRVLLLSNRSEYFGYELIMNAGLAFEKIRFLDPHQQSRNFKVHSMFLRILLGYGA